MADRGRPPKIATPEQFDGLVEAYLERCQKNERPITLSGMVRALGFSSRQSFTDYSKKEEFADSVAKARLAIEESYESILPTSVQGAIFALKVNYGWQDKEVLEVTEISHEDRLEKLR